MYMVCSFVQVLFLFSPHNFDAARFGPPVFLENTAARARGFRRNGRNRENGKREPRRPSRLPPGFEREAAGERLRDRSAVSDLPRPLTERPTQVLFWRRTRGEGASGEAGPPKSGHRFSAEEPAKSKESEQGCAGWPAQARLVDQPVGRERQELLERVGERHVREERNGLLEAAAVERLAPDLAPDPLHLALERVAEKRRRDLAAVVELSLEMEPLPDLGAGDFRRRRVLHQIVDRHGAAAPEPGLDILHADADVHAQALFGALALVHLKRSAWVTWTSSRFLESWFG